jgi:hypothetical protein
MAEKLRIIRTSESVFVLGTNQIAEAAQFAGMLNHKGIYWRGSHGGYYARRRGDWQPVGDGEFSPMPKDARPGVWFIGVRTVPVPGVDLVDKHGDVWTLGDDGLLHTPETAAFPREHVEKKWGPLVPAAASSQPRAAIRRGLS